MGDREFPGVRLVIGSRDKAVYKRDQSIGLVDEKVRLRFSEGLWLKTPTDATALHAGIPGCFDIHFAIAHHEGLWKTGVRFFDDAQDAVRLRLLVGKRVASVDAKEMLADTQRGEDIGTDLRGFVGQNGKPVAASGQLVHYFVDARVEPRVFERMRSIVLQEVREGRGDCLLVCAVPHGLSHKDGGAVADIGVDRVLIERREVEMGTHGVCRDGQIAAGIDERSVEVKDDEQFLFSKIVR